LYLSATTSVSVSVGITFGVIAVVNFEGDAAVDTGVQGAIIGFRNALDRRVRTGVQGAIIGFRNALDRRVRTGVQGAIIGFRDALDRRVHRSGGFTRACGTRRATGAHSRGSICQVREGLPVLARDAGEA
jgi:hypothetical protein